MQLNNAPMAILALVTIGVVASVGARVTSSITSGMGQGSLINNISYAAAGNTTLGIAELSGFLPVVGLVIAAAIVIGLVVMAFASR